jgi:hypothetical protein
MTKTFEQQLIATLSTFAESEGNGVVEVNLTDALLAIAGAIERLAAASERNATAHERSIEMQEQAMAHAKRRAEEVTAIFMSEGMQRQ